MVSLANKATSTHGRTLLAELRDVRNVREDVVLDCIRRDPLAGRLKAAETGDNAYHLLMGRHYDKTFMITVLNELLKVCPEGAKAVNNDGSTPLHLCFTQYTLHIELINTLLQAYPGASKVADNQGLIPLFLCTMREDATAEICRALCKANPDGPNTKNKTGSFPLHFAAKRNRPNLDILQILLRRNPTAAGCMNSFGLLPMHCICALSDNVKAVAMIHEADTEAVKVVDRQGRTCLHLAVLNIGKDHSNAVAVEEEELRMQAHREAAKRQNVETDGTAGSNNTFEDNDYDDETPSSAKGDHLELNEREGKSRAILRYLISIYPQALAMESNFHSTPVDTVLEKTKPVRSKNKIVSVFGLYNDPPTARILLLGQRNRSRGFHATHITGSTSTAVANGASIVPIFNGIHAVLPNLRPRYATALRDFNWMARKFALGVSFVGELRYCQIEKSSTKGSAKFKEPTFYKLKLDITIPSHARAVVVEKVKKTATKGTKSVKSSSAKSGNKDTPDTVFLSAGMAAMQFQTGENGEDEVVNNVNGEDEVVNNVNGGYVIPPNNLLARLRRQGLDELVHLCIAFI